MQKRQLDEAGLAKTKEWIDEAVNQIRWERARALVSPELEDHLEDSRLAYEAAGYDQMESEQLSIRDMGSPLEAGTLLDSVHRPRPNLAYVIAILLFISFGAVLFGLGKSQDSSMTNSFVIGGLYFVSASAIFLTTYFLDYTFFSRHSIGFFSLTLCAFYLIDFLWPVIIFLVGLIGGNPAEYSVYKNSEVLLPFIAAAQVGTYYYIRVYSHDERYRKRWMLAFSIPLLFSNVHSMTLMSSKNFIPIAYLTLTIMYLAFLATEIKKKSVIVPKRLGWFIWWLCLVLNISALVAVTFFRFKKGLADGSLTDFWGMALKNEASAHGSLENIVSDMSARPELLMAYVKNYFGWVIAAAIIVILLAALSWGLYKTLKQQSFFGRMIGTVASVSLLLRVVMHVANCFCFNGLFDYFLPFITNNIPQLITDSFMAGLLLSVLRMEGTARDLRPIPERIT